MENDFIRWVREQLPDHSCLKLAPGDDAAILDWRGADDCVVSVDLLNEGVDFISGQVSFERIGRKALAVNLSDLAAMAAEPVAVVVALLLPQRGGMQIAKQLYAGMIPLAKEFQVAIAGGDTNSWSGPLAISVTILGRTTKFGPVTRSGAKPGDAVLVTGALGGSILGKQFDFQPRVAEALLLNRKYELHAMIDISDGLAIDLWRVAKESGCGATLDAAAILIDPSAHQMAEKSSQSALEHALRDGEDFELLLAVPSDEGERLLADQPLSIPITKIGQFTEDLELRIRQADGRLSSLEPIGFQHTLD